MASCVHQWEDNKPLAQDFMKCVFCKEHTNPKMRAHCTKCKATVCPMCSRFNLGRRLTIQKSNLPQYDNKDVLINELIEYTRFLLAENQRLKEKLLDYELSQEIEELVRDPRKGKSIKKEEVFISDSDYEEFQERQTKITIKEAANILLEEDNPESLMTTVPDPRRGRRVLNRLYNIELTMDIPGVEKFKIQAILDSGATVCCIDKDAVPEAATEPSAYPIQINGVNSIQTARLKLKGGQMTIEENRFRISFMYVFSMGKRDGIQMLIGCNFIRAMQDGLRIEGNMVTFYKNITTIATKVDAEVASAAISELDLSSMEYIEVQRAVAYNCGEESSWFKERFAPLLSKLKD